MFTHELIASRRCLISTKGMAVLPDVASMPKLFFTQNSLAPIHDALA